MSAAIAYEWNALPWRELEGRVFKLQKRIYRASQRGEVKTVHRLQKLLTSSWSARCLAVRRVTQDNQGKKTAGIDGVKSLNPRERLTLVKDLNLKRKPTAVRRVWIPKPGKIEKRPLGIPVMHDRAAQTLVRMTLEPEWEAKFEANSYGFRPGRCTQDAIAAIYQAIGKKPKWVLDADIAQCFDRINHQRLLAKLQTYPAMRKLIKSWLKAGGFDNGEPFTTDAGTPQGGAISPLLANIALHGMEQQIENYALTLKGKKRNNKQALKVIRYADDLVILHESLEVVQQCQQILQDWLGKMGLELKPSKTRITHTLEGERPGFDFLGFNIRQYKVGKHHSGKKTRGGMLGFKTLIKPAKDATKSHMAEVAGIIKRHRSAPQDALMAKLEPVIRGWSNYYKTACSSKSYSSCDHRLWQKLWRWAVRRHPQKNCRWVAQKYWQTKGDRQWIFGTQDHLLRTHRDTKISRHVKVFGSRSPYDGDQVYWGQRLQKYPTLSKRKATLLKRQCGKCAFCGAFFRDRDLLEIDHIVPRYLGGKEQYSNWQLLHRHCHDSKHSTRT